MCEGVEEVDCVFVEEVVDGVEFGYVGWWGD